MDLAPAADEDHPPVVGGASPAVLTALASHRIIAVPNVGGYSLAVRAGSPEDEARLKELAADPDGPHYAVGQIDDVRELTSGWTDELKTLLQRCWPGPVEVFLPSGGSAGSGGSARSAGGPADADAAEPAAAADTHGEEDPDTATTASNGRHGVADDGEPEYGAWAVVVGMPDGRALRRLCREQGPWRTVPLRFTEPEEVARAFRADDVAVVVDGGRQRGPAAHGGRRHGDAHPGPARRRAAVVLHRRDDVDEHAPQALLTDEAPAGGLNGFAPWSRCGSPTTTPAPTGVQGSSAVDRGGIRPRPGGSPGRR